jgi:hypothetical protein
VTQRGFLSARAYLKIVKLLSSHGATLAGHLLESCDLGGSPVVALVELLHDLEVVRSSRVLSSICASSQRSSEFLGLDDDTISSIGRCGEESCGEGIETGDSASEIVEGPPGGSVSTSLGVDVLDEGIFSSWGLVVERSRSIGREELRRTWRVISAHKYLA